MKKLWEILKTSCFLTLQPILQDFNEIVFFYTAAMYAIFQTVSYPGRSSQKIHNKEELIIYKLPSWEKMK